MNHVKKSNARDGELQTADRHLQGHHNVVGDLSQIHKNFCKSTVYKNEK